MTPLPKRRHSTRRGGKREHALKKELALFEKCSKCGATKQSHRVCPKCGYYGEKHIFTPPIPKKSAK